MENDLTPTTKALEHIVLGKNRMMPHATRHTLKWPLNSFSRSSAINVPFDVNPSGGTNDKDACKKCFNAFTWHIPSDTWYLIAKIQINEVYIKNKSFNSERTPSSMHCWLSKYSKIGNPKLSTFALHSLIALLHIIE